MLTHTQLLDQLGKLENAEVSAKQDRLNSVSSKVIRCRYEGQQAVAVGADTDGKTQITALLDLLDLHRHARMKDTAADAVTLIIGGRAGGPEALDAIGTLVRSMTAGPTIRVLVGNAQGVLEPVTPLLCDFSKDSEYPRWLGLLMAVESGPPPIVRELVAAVAGLGADGHDASGALRAYQMLSSAGRWSLRLEGLEVGRFKGTQGWLDVGKIGKTGNVSAQRKAWLNATGTTAPLPVSHDPVVMEVAAKALRKFSQQWLPEVSPQGDAPLKQDEHALESRVLRGYAPVEVPGVGRLELIREDPAVNWGSQFPTKWGRQGSARYLDALLRQGTTPWAVEIKIQGGTGVGGYYRHAVAQAVLYRHFIRQAKPLQRWFDNFDLQREQCQAAVLVPKMTGKQSHWRPRLGTVADMFGVPVIEIDHKYAGIH